MNTQDKKWLTQYDAMQMLQISRSTLYRWCKSGYLTRYSFPNSRIIYVLAEEIEAFLKRNCIDEQGHIDTTGLMK